jgi:GntR family transcriptional regulator
LLVEPLHVQLKRTLIAGIESGAYPAGDRIPSERDLCDQFNVSRTTTRRTISELVHEGWLYTVSGKGTYVSERPLDQELRPFTGFADDLAQRGIQVASRVLAAEDQKATAEIAARLSVLPHMPVIMLHRVRLASSTPIAIQRAFLPEHLCPGLLRFDFAVRSLYDVLRSEYGLHLHRGHSVIRAGLATSEESNLLGMAHPSPILRTYQTTYIEDGQCIEFCESAFHGELYDLTFDTTSREGQISSYERLIELSGGVASI